VRGWPNIANAVGRAMPAKRWLPPALLGLLLAVGCTAPERLLHPPVQALAGGVEADCRESLRVMTLNLAHGRGQGLHQALQSAEVRGRNLKRVRALLAREAPDLVAVQEVDAPSFWSGGIDQLNFLGQDLQFRHYLHGAHVQAPGLAYGNGLLATLALDDSKVVTFAPVTGHPAKGFVAARFRWPRRPGLEMDLVSVHLNPLSAQLRRAQARELVQALAPRQRPLILMGDFNTDWRRPDSALRLIAADLGLRAYRPEAEDLDSFPRLGRRLDWVLVSPELEFLDYRVLEAGVSDHRPVLADLRLSLEAEALYGGPEIGACP
jgi:endonuclease/exonuclease/phosphatase family metal-dependent hydrolase